MTRLIGSDASDDQDTSQNSAKEAMERQTAHDKPAAQALQMSYTQQIASKSLNMQVCGRIWDYEEIWNQWIDFKARLPKAMLIWSGDFANYQRRGTTNFYVVLSGESFSSQSQAQQWCSSAGLGSDDCVVRMIGK